MAVYTDYFIASLEELQKALPLRVPPLPAPQSNGEESHSLPRKWQASRPFPKKALTAEFPTIKECKAVKQFETIEQRNLYHDKLEELFLILSGDDDVFWDEIRLPVLMVPGENPHGGLYQVPPQLVKALAELAASRFEEVTEEWLGDKEAKPALVALHKMAKKAMAEGKGMYLWMLI